MPPILELKNWQLFWIWIGPQLFLFTLGALALLGPVNVLFLCLLLLFVFSLLFFLGIFMLWFYKMGTVLYQYLPQGITMPIKQFNFFLAFAAIYMLCTILAIFSGFSFSEIPADDLSPLSTGLLMGAHLFAMF